MANLFQAWDEDIQALGAAKASDDQIEARRQQLAEHFKAKAKAAGLSSKKIYETLDQFDAYSRQNTTAQDDQLTPEEQEMAQRVKDGTTRTGAIKEVGKAVKDAGIGALSSLAGWGGAIAQTAADVGENDKSELASQAAQGLYNVRDELQSNYSEGTKQAKKDFWTPRGLAMGLAENAGQIAGSATVFGAAGKLAAARKFSRGATLLTAGTVGAPLAYSQGYGQGKENSLDEINKTSNAQLWENVKAEAKAYDDAGGTGEVPYLVKQFKEAGGDLNLMKDLMAENAGNVTGLMTVGTEPLAMGVGSLMSRGAAAGGKGFRAGLVNIMNNQGMSNELARRIAAGASAAEARKAGQIVGTTALRDNAAIASQAAKIAAVQGMRGTGQEGIQEGGEGYIAKTEGSLAAGRKGELTGKDWRGENGIIQQGLQGGAIGALMGGGGAISTLRHSSKLALEKNGLPEKHDAAIIAKEQADAALVQAANIADANPENIDAQKAYADALDTALVATNDLEQLTGKFNALYTPEEQAVIKAATMEGVAARKKVADDAAKAQKELDDANAKEQADIAAQQAEAIKTQRDAVVNNLAGMVGDDVALSNAVADLGLSEEEANSLLDDAHKVAKKQKKEAAKQPAPATATPKTPFEMAVDEAFNADGTRNPKAMSSDIAKKHNIPLKPLVDAISERIDSNSAKNKAAANEALAQKRQKEKLENTLADFAANNDHDSMVNFLSDYEPTEADKLIKNAYASVENKKKAEQDAIAATKKAEALKAKESEAKAQAEQKKIAFNNDMANLYAANPDRNPTKAELDSVGKKHGVKSPIELAQAWVKAKNEAKAAKEAAQVDQGTIAVTDEERLNAKKAIYLAYKNTGYPDDSSALSVSNIQDKANEKGVPFNVWRAEGGTLAVVPASQKSPVTNGKLIGTIYPESKASDTVASVDTPTPETEPIVRTDGQPFQTQAAAEQALKNKSTKKPRKNKAPITPETHEVITVDGGFAIAPVVEVEKPKKPDDNEDGGVIADAPKPNAPVSPTGEQVVDTAPTKPVEDDGIKTKHIKQPKPVDRVVYPDRDNLLTAIAKLKELDRDDVIRQMGLDRADYGKRAAGLLGVFKKDGTGLSLDAMATTLSGYGYPVNEGGNTPYDNINGTPTPDALLDALRKALFGEDVGTEEYILNKYAAQREADQKEAEEMERLFNGKGSSTWDEADALDNVSNAIVDDIVSGTSGIAPEKLSETLKEVSNEPIIEIGGQAPNAKTEARSPQNGDAETTGTGKTGQQESQSSTGQDSGIGLNPSFNLNAQTNEELAKRDADNKAAEAKRQAEEKAAKDKAQADKEVNDFRLSGSNAPADIAMAGGQKDMFAPPTRGEREAEKAKQEPTKEEPVKWFGTQAKADDWVAKQKGQKFDIRQSNGRFEIYPVKEQAQDKSANQFGTRGEAIKHWIANNKGVPFEIVESNGLFEAKEPAIDEDNSFDKRSKVSKLFTWWGTGKMTLEDKRALLSKVEAITGYMDNANSSWNSLKDLTRVELTKIYDKEQQEKSVQNNEPAPTKQPETKTEPKSKIDFSEASVKLEDALNKWEAIKKGDIVVTKSGRALIAQSDAKGKMSIRFKAREGGLEEALSIVRVTGDNKVSKMLSDRLQEQSKNELVKKLIGKTPEGNDLYEDGRGVRFTDNGRGVQVGEDVAITMQNGKTVYDVSGRTDEHRTVEEVAARQPKQPTKKESLLIKIDDELDAALDDLANVFKEQGKRLSSGVDPVILGKVLVFGAKASSLYIAKGAVKFAVWAENMINGLSSKGVSADVVKPYLKQLYLASKVDISPEIRKQMDKEDDVYDFDFATLNVDQEEKTDSTGKTPTKETLTDLFYKHLKQGTLPENNVNLRKMVAEFDGKEVDNYRLKEAQEMLEAAIARHSRDIVASNHNGDASTFNQLVDAYNKQPNLNIRTSTSIENQAYSTPAPLAFVAAKMANIGKNTTVYEPTAGNGMLLITALPENATVNEMESTRFNNLKDQGFNAHQGDALKAIENGVVKPNSQDAIITNPPFGSIKENGKTVKVAVDGYKIGKIDHLIAVEALKAMKPNGTAAIIIGADMVQGGISTDDRIFFNWLYANYNVVGHFEVDGKLYSRQGASWPVRVIIVHGKQASDKNSPVTGAIPRYENWKDVYDQYTKMVVASNNRGLSSDTSGTNNSANDTRTPQDVDGVKTTQASTGGRNTTGNNDDVDGASTRNVSNRSRNGGKQLPVSDNVQRFDERTNAQDNLAVGDNRDTGVTTGNDSRVDGRSKPDGNTGKDVAVLSDADNSFQVKYTPASSRKDEGVLIPINMRQPLMDSLLTLEDNVGDIDEYAAKELGYRNTEQLHDALMGLQVDSVASAIYQIKEKNKGIIIADQTGIGKGRQAAAIIRWAMLNGHTPVFVTVKPQLFTDMYGDLSDIGSNDVKPFIVNTGESISGKDGKKLHKTKPDAKHRKEVEDIAGDGVLPDDYNAVFITYSQINKTNNQQRLLSALSGNAIFILDESHNAGGASSTGMFMQEVLKEAKGVVYLSATFAKRPDNMPLYFKTDMGLAVGDTNELSTAVMQGGLPLQTVISNSLVKAGQLFRRERSYNGVSIETKVDSTNKVEHEKLSDEATKALRAIVAADRMFHNNYFAQLEKEVEAEGKQARAAGNKAEKSVNHHEFSSVVHNFIRQMLLGLKVDTAANEAIAALKRGEKPVIALENTMGSFLNEYVSANGLKDGDSLGDFGYRDVLSRALHRTRAVTIKDKKGEETRKEVGLHELDSATRAAYNEAQKIIDSLDVTIPASPIDWMRSRIEKAGYTVAEITGRNMAVDYSTKTPTVSQVPLSEQNDKVGTTRMFNSGELDAIILNVAGSTGISLHASEKFKDQRVRHMIVAQPAQDINIFMQMLGRIHRTGQVVLPKYTILTLDLPTEKRPTAVLNKKMKSLNANTSSNTESATSIVSMDMLNKYGDKVVAAYLSENQDIAKKIGMEVHGDTSSSETNDDFAKKATGRFALLPIQEQNKIYEEIEPQYAALISYLDETGQNELEPKTIDFEAELKLESTAVPATDPSTPFGQEAIYGEYKVKPQGKPMTIDEVKALITKNIGEGVMPAQHTQKLITDGQNGFDSFIATLEKKYQEAKDDEEAGNIQKNIANQKTVFENTKSFIESHRVGSIWQIDIKGDIYNAVITNVKSTFKKGGHGNPFAQSKIIISLAVNGELRSVTVPLTEFSRIEVSKYYGTAQDALKQRGDDSALAKIITGNLLAAYANIQGSDGRVISFTKKDGSVEQGILLPKKFNFKDNVRQDFAIKDANDVFKLLKSGVTDILKTGVASRKGDIRIIHNTNTGGITIYTPKAKTTGGKWFLDKKLIGITGDFVSNGNTMMVSVPSSKAVSALSAVINKSPLYVLPSQADATKELLGYHEGQVNLKEDKPKFSRGTGEGLTTTQTRTILVKHFGEKLIKALESSGLLTITATPPSWAEPDADGAYHNGKAYLFTDNLSAETVVATLAHELSGHKGFQELMTPTAYDSLMRQFNRLVKQGNAIALAAKARAEAAEVVTPTADTKEAIALAEKQTLQRQQDELLPYLLTLQATLNATRSQQSAVTKVIEQVYRAVKAWLYRTLSAKGYDGLASKLLQPKDITLLAERMIREMGNGTNPSNNTKGKSQQGMARRDFVKLLAVGSATISAAGVINFLDSKVSNTKSDAIKSVVDEAFPELLNKLNPSENFLKVLDRAVDNQPSNTIKTSSKDAVDNAIQSLRASILYFSNFKQNKVIETNLRDRTTGTPVYINYDDLAATLHEMKNSIESNRDAIEKQITLSASFVEGITGIKLKKFDIFSPEDSGIIHYMYKTDQAKSGTDKFVDIGAETYIKGIELNPEILIRLISTDRQKQLSAFQTLSHELTHVIQNQTKSQLEQDNARKGISQKDSPIGVDTFIPEGIENIHKKYLERQYEGSSVLKEELEGFNVGYTAAKAWLRKNNMPLRIASKQDIIERLEAAEKMSVDKKDLLDKFGYQPTYDSVMFSQLNTPQTQINAVRRKYEGTSQWMKAPNGQPTKLNEMQWLQVRTPNFKAWFGDWENDPKNASKVVDSNGEPMVVYHGTEYGGFTEFGSSGYGAASREKGFWFSNKIRALEYSGKNQEIEIVPVLKSWSDAAYFAKKLDVEFKKAPEDEYDDGIYFIDDDIASTLNQARNILQKAIEDKQPAGIYPVFLSLKTPKTINAKGKLATNINTLVMSNVPKKYDGMMIVDVDDAGRFGDYGYITDNYVAKTSTQIKSAIGNTGEFNPTNPDIRFSRKAKNPITEGIKSVANDAKNSLPKPISGKIDHFLAGRRLPSNDLANIVSKTELSLYHRTIGTQQNTALQNADFKKVYDMAQRYLQHVAVDAYAALKVAPNLLGKLESWSDLKKDVKKIWPANFIKQKADRAAVASIIFDETLNNELLSDADILKALTRDQRQIYKEARDAIQVSLENTAKSEMVRKLLAAEAINWQTVESLINQDLPVGQFAQAIRDLVESRIGGFKNELEAILDADPKIKDALKTSHDKKLTPQTPAQKLTLKEARLTPEQMRTPAQKLAIEEAKATPNKKQQLTPAQKATLKKAKTLKAQIETTEEALKSLNDVEKRLETLIEQGYAPLMRFGEYTLTVRDLDGKVKSFFMFESKAEQVRATNAIVARYGKTVNLETDMVSKEEFKQFAGMTPETMALFARETGMDKDEAYQRYLKHAIPARSAMTRMIKRKGTEGFSDDIQRVVASFVMSNARMSAKNIYAAQIEKSIQDIESGKSVKDQAYVMKENVFNPKENFAQLRNFLFLWNLGGSIFFGLLNMTQPYMQTLPHLSQYVPIKEAFNAIIKGSGIAGSAMKNGTAPKGYEAEYNRAVREGVVDPQNVFMLSGVERGKTGASNSAWGVITHTMGLIAQVTESFNRKAVFIAALEVANKKGAVWLKKKGFNSAYDFAKDTVDQTQGVYDKANRSNWANTSVGAPLMVFKQFSINYVEQMVRMWKKEAASGDEGKKAVFLMLALLASLSGVMGLPFIKDILDVSETTAAFLGNPVNIEREARLALGKDLADPLFNGVLNHFVFNNLGMDIQGRTGMPDLVPWSNALNPTLSAQGRINEFASIAGATGGLIEKGYDATQLIARDEYGAAAKTLAPRFLTSWIDGSKMALTNEVMDRKGNKLFDTTWDEGLVKFIDANPKRMADLSRTKSLEWKDKSIQDYMTTSFKQKLINAMMDKDQAEVNNLMVKVKAWNDARPHYPIYIDLNNIAKAANKKDQTFDARESIPKGQEWWKAERPEM